jgi:hypothetical protein
VDRDYDQYAFVWPRIKAGLTALNQEYPDSSELQNWLARMACRYKDKDAGRSVFKRLKDRWDRDSDYVWPVKQSFDMCRSWAK